MAVVQEFVAIDAPREAVFRLIRDRAQRARFLPDGWRVIRLIGGRADAVGSAMEIEAQFGPGMTSHVIETYEITEDQLFEGPPPRDNYITTWTVGADERATLVGLHTRFSYGDIFGEFFVRRRLRRAYRQQLQRLKAVAEAEASGVSH